MRTKLQISDIVGRQVVVFPNATAVGATSGCVCLVLAEEYWKEIDVDNKAI